MSSELRVAYALAGTGSQVVEVRCRRQRSRVSAPLAPSLPVAVAPVDAGWDWYGAPKPVVQPLPPMSDAEYRRVERERAA
jgi:hypothetical protein